MQESYKNKLLMDASTFQALNQAHLQSMSGHAEASRDRQTKTDKNARNAVNSFLFGTRPSQDDEGAGPIGSAGAGVPGARVEFAQEKLANYASALLPKIYEFVRRSLQHPGAARRGIQEQDVAVILVADFNSMGSLKAETLRATSALVQNFMGGHLRGYAVVLHPERPKGYSQCVLSKEEREARRNSIGALAADDDDADMLVDEEATTLPDVPVESDTKKTTGQKRSALSQDIGEITSVLGRADTGAYYPEAFVMTYEATAAGRHGRQGFIVRPVQGGDWIASGLSKGGIHDLPVNEQYVKVSMREAKRARTEGAVSFQRPQDASQSYGWQKGEKAERKFIEDAIHGAKGKKMIVFVDLFVAVGDRVLARYSQLRDRGTEGAQGAPLTFFFGVEPREHFFRIASVRLMAQAAADFNAQKLDCPGFIPLPAHPPAWQGKAPSLEKFVEEIRAQLQVATVTDDGVFLVPKDGDVPHDIGVELRETLGKLRMQFPPPPEAEAPSRPGGLEAAPVSLSGARKFHYGPGSQEEEVDG